MCWKTMEKCLIKLGIQIKNNSSNDYDYHYLRIKINSDHDLSLE